MGNSPHVGMDPDGGWNAWTALGIAVGSGYAGGVISSGSLNPFDWNDDDLKYGFGPGFAAGSIVGFIGWRKDWKVNEILKKTIFWRKGDPDPTVIEDLLPDYKILVEEAVLNYWEYADELEQGAEEVIDVTILGEDLRRIAEAIGRARDGDKWDDIVDPAFWDQHLTKESDFMAKDGYNYIGKISGVEITSYNGESVTFTIPKFHALGNTGYYTMNFTKRNLERGNFGTTNPATHEKLPYPYQVRITGEFGNRRSQVAIFKFEIWEQFEVFSRIILNGRK